MNSRRNLCVELILAILLFVLHNVSCSSKSNLREERSEENVDPGEPLYLTPYLERGEVDLARNKSKVTLPGFPDIVSYAGYFDIEIIGRKFHSFLWYFPAQVDSENAPVVLSLANPFISSFSSVLSGKAGYAKMREESWNKKQNIIHIDSMLEGSYSFPQWGPFFDNTEIEYELYKVVPQFFEVFPWLQKNDFFVADEFRVVENVATVSLSIIKHNKYATQDKKINLKGIVVGSGIIGLPSPTHVAEYLYGCGLMDAEGRKKILDDGDTIVFWHYIGAVGKPPLVPLVDVFIGQDFYTEHDEKMGWPWNILEDKPYRNNNDYADWIQSTITRRALHVGNTEAGGFSPRYRTIFYDRLGDFVEFLENYRVLYYSGNFDVVCPYPSVESIIDNLSSPSANEIKRSKRQEWKVGDELAGYIRKGGNLTQVLIRNAGRFPTLDQPKWTARLIEAFTHGSL